LKTLGNDSDFLVGLFECSKTSYLEFGGHRIV